MPTASEQHICQVAFTALDAAALREWYANVFGLVRSGRIVFFPPATSRVQGVPGAWEKCSWLLDQQDYFQLEFFQFLRPLGQLRPAAWRLCDPGYNLLGIAVADFDQVLRNVGAFSATPAPRVVGSAGARRACVRDPEGNWVEIYETDPLSLVEGIPPTTCRPEVPAVVRSLRVSVPSLEEARQAFVDAMGLQEVADFRLHTAEDEKRWGLPRARARYLLLRSGNFLLELVEYARPAPAPWPPNYSLADQGIMNFAFGYRDGPAYDRAFSRATAAGMKANGEVVSLGLGKVMYLHDRHGFSVEMLTVHRSMWWLMGFSPAEGYVEIEVGINAPTAEVWRQLTDHAGMGRWSPFVGRILRAGETDPNGVGCLRELTAPGLRIVEEVTAWEDGRHYSYQLRRGAPFRRHQGDVFVSDDAGRSRVRWAIRFDCWIPGGNRLLSWLLGLAFRRALRRLKARMEAFSPEERF